MVAFKRLSEYSNFNMFNEDCYIDEMDEDSFCIYNDHLYKSSTNNGNNSTSSVSTNNSSTNNTINNTSISNNNTIQQYEKKRRIEQESTCSKRYLTNYDIIQRIIDNNIKICELNSTPLHFQTSLSIKIEEEDKYTVVFIAQPTEKGILSLPNLSIGVIVNGTDVLPCTITFKNNYPSDVNLIFVHIRNHFHHSLLEKTTSIIHPSSNASYHLHQSSLSLPFVLNTWIRSIVHTVNSELT